MVWLPGCFSIIFRVLTLSLSQNRVLILSFAFRTMSTLNGNDEKATGHDDQTDHPRGESTGVSKLQQHHQQQRHDRNQQLHFTQV